MTDYRGGRRKKTCKVYNFSSLLSFKHDKDNNYLYYTISYKSSRLTVQFVRNVFLRTSIMSIYFLQVFSGYMRIPLTRKTAISAHLRFSFTGTRNASTYNPIVNYENMRKSVAPHRISIILYIYQAWAS